MREKKLYLIDGGASVRGLTDCDGRVTDAYIHDAFGNLISHEGESTNEYGFQGEQQDETGLYYLRARYMNPSTGTFTSMDTYGGSLSDPTSLHKYLFANSNPVKYCDPSGYSSSLVESLFVCSVIGVIYGMADYLDTTLTTDQKFSIAGLMKSILVGAARGFGAGFAFGIIGASCSAGAIIAIGTGLGLGLYTGSGEIAEGIAAIHQGQLLYGIFKCLYGIAIIAVTYYFTCKAISKLTDAQGNGRGPEGGKPDGGDSSSGGDNSSGGSQSSGDSQAGGSSSSGDQGNSGSLGGDGSTGSGQTPSGSTGGDSQAGGTSGNGNGSTGGSQAAGGSAGGEGSAGGNQSTGGTSGSGPQTGGDGGVPNTPDTPEVPVDPEVPINPEVPNDGPDGSNPSGEISNTNPSVPESANVGGNGDGVAGEGGSVSANQRGVGGKGWRGDKTWRQNVNQVDQGGTIKDLNGQIPSEQEAIDLIWESGGTVNRIDGPHNAPNPHNYNHINYTTFSGNKGTIRIK